MSTPCFLNNCYYNSKIILIILHIVKLFIIYNRMANIEDFINTFCSSELGYRNKTTT
jgi:hypothetical protein